MRRTATARRYAPWPTPSSACRWTSSTCSGGSHPQRTKDMNPRVQLILDEQARHRHQFEAFCRSLTEPELETAIPGSTWTVKDYIAHLGTIDGLIAHNFQQLV